MNIEFKETPIIDKKSISLTKKTPKSSSKIKQDSLLSSNDHLLNEINDNFHSLNLDDDHDELNDDVSDLDQAMINYINFFNNKEQSKIPTPTPFIVSTRSAMCKMEHVSCLDLSKIVSFISYNIISNIIFKKDLNYLIRGISIENIILRFDESYLKKYKKPYVKFFGNIIDPSNQEDCLLMFNNLHLLETNSLKKQGRQKNKKENGDFYNSCSIIVKPSLDVKCVNIKLFNNGNITLTGSKGELDGFNACTVLLNEIKKRKEIFPNMIPSLIDQSKIIGYKITMINSDFNTNFKIDLNKLLDILNNLENNLFIKFNPEKYRGLIIGFYWNEKNKGQLGICHCSDKCKGKGNGKGEGQCKKITISIFKSGSIIITGGFLIKQVEDAYSFINDLLKKFYHDIIKLSILDFIDESDD
jgi:TATA-box binding protein (TBP) (component of TFIID and TFIIIB)